MAEGDSVLRNAARQAGEFVYRLLRLSSRRPHVLFRGVESDGCRTRNQAERMERQLKKR